MLSSKFQVNYPLSSGEKAKKDLHDGHHVGHHEFPLGTSFTIFDQQVTQMLPTKFQVNWSFGSGEEATNRFSKWRPPWISDQNDFSYFFIYKSP